MSDVLIRRERADHPWAVALIAELDRYLASLYAPEHNHLLDVKALLAPEVNFLLAVRGDEALGCAATRRMPGEAATAGVVYGEVKRMFVAPAARGHGLGASLLALLEDDLRAKGVGLALLETGAEQTAAVRLYERCGYERRGPFAGYPDNGLSLFFGKRLAA